MPHRNPIHVIHFDKWFAKERDKLDAMTSDDAYNEAARHAAQLVMYDDWAQERYREGLVFHNTGRHELTLGVVDTIRQGRGRIGITLTFPEKMRVPMPGVRRPSVYGGGPIRAIREFHNQYPTDWLVSSEREAIFTEEEMARRNIQAQYDSVYYETRDACYDAHTYMQVIVNSGPVYLSWAVVDALEEYGQRLSIVLVWPDKADEQVEAEGLKRKIKVMAAG